MVKRNTVSVKRLVDEGEKNCNGVIIDHDSQVKAIYEYIANDGCVYYDDSNYDSIFELNMEARTGNLIPVGKIIGFDNRQCNVILEDELNCDSKRIEFWYECINKDGDYIVNRIIKVIMIDI